MSRRQPTILIALATVVASLGFMVSLAGAAPSEPAQPERFAAVFNLSFADEPQPGCGLADTVFVRMHGTARTTLGNATAHHRHCFNIPRSEFAHGQFNLTFDSGDTLRGTYSGVQFPADELGRSLVEASVEFTGGTGSYADATGNAVVAGQIDPTGDALITMWGTISLPD